MTFVATNYESLALGSDLDFPVADYSKREIEDASEVLRGRAMYDDVGVTAFTIAHSWRNAHIVPMRRIRRELTEKTKRVQDGGITAARLKRMSSIRKKLRESPRNLYQLQDIGGCRAIVSSMRELDALVAIYKAGGSQHDISREDNYIALPKAGGYRSHHLVFKFRGEGEDAVFNRQRIEVQLRTRLQHAWATAVEAVGLVRGEDLKGGKGNADWLRFFELMSSEFADEEQRALVGAASQDRRARRAELRTLDRKLTARFVLEKYNFAIKHTDQFASNANHRYYILQYDRNTNNISVKSYAYYPDSYDAYVAEERDHGNLNTVLVEVDKVSDLKFAYPNYFLDVQMFTQRLQDIISPIVRAAARPIDNPPAPVSGWRPDLSWLSWFKR